MGVTGGLVLESWNNTHSQNLVKVSGYLFMLSVQYLTLYLLRSLCIMSVVTVTRHCIYFLSLFMYLDMVTV